jgi:hypothetical protein
MTRLSRLTLASAFAAAGCTMLWGGQACSLQTLRGDYGFTITGQILDLGPVAGVAMTHYEGNGTLTQVDHVVHNGVVPAEAWRPATGNYTVNSDCTGTMTLVFSDGSPTMHLHIAIANFGNEIRTVVDGPVAITSIGTKRGWWF